MRPPMSKMKHVRTNDLPTREAGDDGADAVVVVAAVERVPTVTERATRTADRVDADAVAAALAGAERGFSPTYTRLGPTAVL